METTVFKSGGSQAVRIPKEFRFSGKRVEIERKGETLVLRPLLEESAWPDGYIDSLKNGSVDGFPSLEVIRSEDQGLEREEF